MQCEPEMSGAGTDRSKAWIELPCPVVVLVEPQMAENIGTTARAMANFGLTRLRLVAPRDGWPNPRAYPAASGADRILDQAELFPSLEAALADCHHAFACTARAHDQAKPVLGPDAAAAEAVSRIAGGQNVAVVFGRERNGLEHFEVAMADAILTLPVNPGFASLNLAQAVLVVAYEWFKLAGSGLPLAAKMRSEPASRVQLLSFFDRLTSELDAVGFFRPPEKREVMRVNLINIFHRTELTRQDVQTLSGVLAALTEGRKGPIEGGVLDGAAATALRTLIVESAAASPDPGRGSVKGLARLLRRNPAPTERLLWEALVKDGRFAGRGFKRQVPVGPHIPDLVSFPLKIAIEIVADAADANQRAERRAWLEARGYRVLQASASEIGTDVGSVLDRLSGEIGD